MAKRVFFSFHYEDVASFRANVVRKSWITKTNREDAGFFDASLWEQVKKEGDLAIKRLINKGLKNTSVTTVLTGEKTYSRPWVQYELLESFKRGNSIVNVTIHNIKDKTGNYGRKGPNPLNYLYFRKKDNGETIHLWQWKQGDWKYYDNIKASTLNYTIKLDEGAFSNLFPTYDWIKNDGYNNFNKWIIEEEKYAL